MGKVITNAEAEADADDIWRWVSNDSVRAADRLLMRFDDAAALLADSPDMGRSREDLAPGVRSFPVGPYLLFYRAIPGGVEIARVLDGRRDIGPDLF